ncbi:hypothetical protein GF362_01485 [Candidatus Dojkabacteria bacterium]|nr:hypothetical protein [Candidatus Dojkabacteria bacterium]
MNKLAILKQLTKSYNLKNNYFEILKELLEKDLSAVEILERTSISSGRIYGLLAELEDLHLVDKIHGKPAIYTLEKFDDNIRNFLQHTYGSFVAKQTEISNMLSVLSDQINISIGYGDENINAELRRMYKECKWAKILHKERGYPWFLIIDNEEQFFKIRHKIRTSRLAGSPKNKVKLLLKRESYRKAYKNKQMDHIMSREAFNRYVNMLEELFGKDVRKQIIQRVYSKLKDNSRITIQVQKNSSNPYSIYITDKMVLIALLFQRQENRYIKMTGGEIIKSYKGIFEKYIQNTESIIPLLEDYI